MNRRMHPWIMTALTGAFLLCTTALAQDKKEKAPAPAPQGEQAEMMKKWEESMTPGAPHKALEAFAGSWDLETKMWMGGPGAPPTVSKGTAEMKMVLGGRFLQQDAKGEMMGMPFIGQGLTGYDNFNKKYVGFWVDNSSTGIFTMDGAANTAGTVFTMYGKSDDPMTGEHGKSVKYITRVVNKDKHIFEVHDLSLGEPNTKVMEIVYTRKK